MTALDLSLLESLSRHINNELNHSLTHRILSRNINTRIRIACLGVAGTVFLAFQYARRDNSNLLAEPSIWRRIDSLLPTGYYLRVRKFLDDNFILRLGDERIRPWTLITSAFSHIKPGHLMSNVIGFHHFSTVLIDILSPLSYTTLILGSALAASCAQLTSMSRMKFPNRRVGALGMSGITCGLGAAAAVINPYRLVSVSGIQIPMWAFCVGFAAYDMLMLNSEASQTGHPAHLSGTLVGLIGGFSLKYAGLLNLHAVHSQSRQRWLN